mmetsp:Transcript_58774/g.137214  ORF Transcript_58774/g.137214 Transcript_58774/m.137214 type:complete len:327 (+) Transcript_58774:87-1067(+)
MGAQHSHVIEEFVAEIKEYEFHFCGALDYDEDEDNLRVVNVMKDRDEELRMRPVRRKDRSKGQPTLQRPGAAQESDQLESRKGIHNGDELTKSIQLVSLGCYCGVKASFQSIGRGSEHMPFDWMRTSLDGLLHFIRSDFAGFFNYVSGPISIPGQTCVLYRGYQHSFWHDNPTDPAMVSKYERRMDRFNSIDGDARKVLFVRAVCDTKEVARAPELLHELKEAFGRQCMLLMVMDFQHRMHGPVQTPAHPDILWYWNPPEAHKDSANVYVKPVLQALDWVVGRPVSGSACKSVEEIFSATDRHTAYYAYDHWVFEGLGVDGQPTKL